MLLLNAYRNFIYECRARHLSKIKYKIAFYLVNKAAKYADKDTKQNAYKPEYCKKYIGDTPITSYEDFNKFNATSVGNLAYCLLLSPYPYNIICAESLNNYRDFIYQFKNVKMTSVCVPDQLAMGCCRRSNEVKKPDIGRLPE